MHHAVSAPNEHFPIHIDDAKQSSQRLFLKQTLRQPRQPALISRERTPGRGGSRGSSQGSFRIRRALGKRTVGVARSPAAVLFIHAAAAAPHCRQDAARELIRSGASVFCALYFCSTCFSDWRLSP